MKKTIKINLLKNICFSFIAIALIHTSSVFAISANKMVKFDEKKGYLGFTDETKELIKKSRETLLQRKKAFSSASLLKSQVEVI